MGAIRAAGPASRALVAYVAVSFLFFGWRLLPHPGRPLVGTSTSADPQKFVWWFEWWPHAILNGTNPFVTHAIFAPTGINLAWTTSVPGLAAAFSPVTLLFGPTVSYNVAAVLLPALSAWAAYLLFQYATGSTWASAVGGYLYGFSSYELGHQLGGHLNLTAAFILPLVALVVLRYLRGDLSRRRLGVSIGILFAAQAYIAIEVAMTLTFALAFALGLAAICIPDKRRQLRASVAPAAAGLGLAGLLAAPLLYAALITSSPQSVIDASSFNADLLNLAVPTATAGWSGDIFASLAARFRGGINEQSSYIGIPALLMIALLLVRKRTPTIRFLVFAFVAATILSFGSALYVNGHRVTGLPWGAISHIPIVDNLIPSRLALYAILAADALVVLWIANTKGRIFSRPYVLPICALVAIAPPVWSATFVQHPVRLAFFSDGHYKDCIPRNETLLIFPFGNTGQSMLWQAEAGFWFNMTAGDVTARYPAGFLSDPTINRLALDWPSTTKIPPADLLALTKRRGVDRVVSATRMVGTTPGTTDPLGFVYPDRKQMRVFGQPQQISDALISPACNHPPLNSGQ